METHRRCQTIRQLWPRRWLGARLAALPPAAPGARPLAPARARACRYVRSLLWVAGDLAPRSGRPAHRGSCRSRRRLLSRRPHGRLAAAPTVTFAARTAIFTSCHTSSLWGCKAAKRPSRSRGALVDVMQAVQHRPGPDRTSHGAWSWLRCLQAKGPMRPVLVVVVDEFGQHRQQVVLVQDDQMVQALSPEGPDDAFHDRVRTR
jgi:hypothetical protein